MRAAAVILILMIGCSKGGESAQKVAPPPGDSQTPAGPGPSKPTAPPAPTPKPTAAVVLEGASGPQKVWVEIVRKQHEIRKGMMFREHLPQDQGMLFLMGVEKVHTFYMRNTLIPLDIIFITRDKTVAGVVENAVPLDETSRDVGKQS